MAAKKAERKVERKSAPDAKKIRPAEDAKRDAGTGAHPVSDQAEEVRLREIIEAASPYAIMTTDPDGVITLFSAGAENMLGYRAEDVAGKATPLIFLTESEIATRSRKLADESGQPVIGFDIFSRPARLHGSDEREWTCIRRDGSSIFTGLTVTAMKDPPGPSRDTSSSLRRSRTGNGWRRHSGSRASRCPA